ncbi:MFS transporter [Nocardioides sp. zg-536]|uniref:MFS transporter n=2 Tax=Nocardioides faecalis TaxID=2803858 RepID=A0A938XZU8_9ACTN|nr:MFS transporter [Nocardioides faecalis]MBS4751510.1 MFS transporter [Nocardioides faecalis]QVI60472.1 MFS transporter [Nocardioides faecalis]
MLVLDGTITNIALPHIARDLAMTGGTLTWVVTIYALSFGGLLLLGGRLGDLLGRRRTFTVGLSIFAFASLLGGCATEGWMLLASRALQGVGAALASPAALALITTNFPVGPQRSKAMGVFAGMSGIGAATGLLLGGFLTGLDSIFGMEVTGWRLTLWINAPIGLVAALLAPRWLRESERSNARLDVPGAVTATGGLLALVYGLSRAGEAEHGWDDPITALTLAVGVALLVAFVVTERRVAAPLMPLRLLLDRTRGTSFGAMIFAAAAMFAMFYFNGQFVQRIMGYEPLHAGVAFLPFSVAVMTGAAIASIGVRKVSVRYITGTGTLLASIALFGFSRYDVDDSVEAVLRSMAPGGEPIGAGVSYLTDFLPFLVMMGIGMGMTFVPMTLTAVHAVRREDAGVGSGMLNTVQQVGGALGLAILGTVSLHFINDRTTDISGPLREGIAAGGLDPDASVPGGSLSYLDSALYTATYTEGATHAFLGASVLMLVASLVIWTFMRVSPTELTGPQGAGHGEDVTGSTAERTDGTTDGKAAEDVPAPPV